MRSLGDTLVNSGIVPNDDILLYLTCGRQQGNFFPSPAAVKDVMGRKRFLRMAT